MLSCISYIPLNYLRLMYIAINMLQLLEQLIIDKPYDNYYISQTAFELYRYYHVTI